MQVHLHVEGASLNEDPDEVKAKVTLGPEERREEEKVGCVMWGSRFFHFPFLGSKDYLVVERLCK